MRKLLHTICLLLLTAASFAEPVTQSQTATDSPATLDAQLQTLKQDALQLSEQLSRIEQQLLYPADTHINLFVSLADNTDITLESARLEIDGQRVASHIYTDSENQALQNGGVQRLYTGNVTPGQHDILLEVVARNSSDEEIRLSDSLSYDKNDKAAFVEMQLAPAEAGVGIRFNTE